MSNFYAFLKYHGVKKDFIEYSRGGQTFRSYGWKYTSPFRYSKICPGGHELFFRLVELDKLINRLKKDDAKLNNWKTRFGKIPLSSEDS